MYIKNSSVPKTEPCGTPQVIPNIEEDAPPVETNCSRLTKNDLNQSLTTPRMP